MKYKVLAPVYKKRKDQNGDVYFDVSWKTLSRCNNIENAIKKYGRNIVFEEIVSD